MAEYLPAPAVSGRGICVCRLTLSGAERSVTAHLQEPVPIFSQTEAGEGFTDQRVEDRIGGDELALELAEDFDHHDPV